MSRCIIKIIDLEKTKTLCHAFITLRYIRLVESEEERRMCRGRDIPAGAWSFSAERMHDEGMYNVLSVKWKVLSIKMATKWYTNRYS